MKGNLGHTAPGVTATLTIYGDIDRLRISSHDELADKREAFWSELLPRLHRNLARRRLMRCKPVRVARFIGAFLGTIQRGGADSMR